MAQSDDADLPLGRRLTTLAGGLVENQGNFQDIDSDKGLVENRSTPEPQARLHACALLHHMRTATCKHPLQPAPCSLTRRAECVYT